jgi:YidC/Oxa1 family membrane protein insertase
MTDQLATSLSNDAIFDHVLVSDSFTGAGVGVTSKWVTAFLVIAMTATTFTTQRQLMRKNMPESALTGQYAQQQKLLLYVLPVVFAVGGIAFPIGVLLYWTTSNLWTMGQQFYVIRNNPTPGTPAFEAKKKRDLAKQAEKDAAKRGPDDEDPPGTVAKPADPEPKPPPARQQPKKQSRSQRKRK